MEIRISSRSLLLGASVMPLFLLSGIARTEVLAVGGPLQEIYTEEESSSYSDELALLRKKEEILQSHFDKLTEEDDDTERERVAVERALVRAHQEGETEKIAALEKRLREFTEERSDVSRARAMLTALKTDQRRYEELLLASYHQTLEKIPERHSVFIKKTLPSPSAPEFAFSWPVSPWKGVSATFQDAGYKKRFGMEHNAIDIPIPQGSPVFAPAEGDVLEVHDRGYGFSTVLLSHEGDLVTLFGHVSEILVEEGDHVAAGERIALSGGRPGTKGAGLLTTGPHLHFEVHVYGTPIDPLYYLPPVEIALSSAN